MRKKIKMFQGLALVMQLGLSMAIPFVVGIYLGGKIDKALGTQPLFLILLLLIFGAGAFVNLFKMTGLNKKKYTKEEKLEECEGENVDKDGQKG